MQDTETASATGDGDDPLVGVRESLDGVDVDGRREHRDVVERHVDRRVAADLVEVCPYPAG